ncbi:MAG: hypothetical protein JWM95_5374, partial [Gemmatimonadetes bacterium]|nr:hypothetical protein [Gemmatimonadota bacterium]
MTFPIRRTSPRRWSLRGTLLLATVTVVSIAALLLVGSVSLAISWRDAGERESR